MSIEQPKKRGRRKTVQSRGLCQRTFKKPDGTTYVGEIWYMRYAAPDPDNPGKTKMVFESTGKTDKAEAYEELVKRKAAVYEERHPELKRANEKTFKKFVEEDYLPYCANQRNIENKTCICNVLIKYFGRHYMKDITAMMVAGYLKDKSSKAYKTKIVNGKEVGIKCGAGTLNKHLTIIQHIFTVATMPEYKICSAAKSLEIHTVKKRQEQPGRDGALTLKQLDDLLKAAESNTLLHQFIRFAVNTGLRRGRIFELTWDMVDLENLPGYISIPIDKHGGRHDVPLHEDAYVVLKEREAVKQDDIPFVFYREKLRDRLYDVKKEFNKAKIAAGLGWYHLHDLRHTFVSQAIMSGIDVKTVQILSGHKTDNMVSRYAHLHPEHKAKEITKLNLKYTPPEQPTPDTSLDSAGL